MTKKCGETIGVDDFAYCNQAISITSFQHSNWSMGAAITYDSAVTLSCEWLKNNKHVKVVTRDRASAYAKAISEELPDVMMSCRLMTVFIYTKAF